MSKKLVIEIELNDNVRQFEKLELVSKIAETLKSHKVKSWDWK